MSTVKRKVKSRDIKRKAIENMITKVEENIEKNPTDLAEIIATRDTIVEKFNSIKLLDDEIFDLMLDDDANLPAEEEATNEFTQLVKKKLYIMTNHINSKEETVSINSSKSSSSSTKPSIKLPNIHLQKFNGNPQDWQSFIDSFDCAIDSNENLSKIQKLTYLKNLLTDTAASIIGGISLSNDNYDIAMKLLRDRFDNKQLLISSHMKSLLQIEIVSDIRNVKDLRKIYDNIETQIRSLETLGIKSDTYGPLLVPILMSKLPEEINLKISLNFDSTDSWDINTVLKIFKTELCAREKTCMISNVNIEEASHMSAAALLTGDENKDNKSRGGKDHEKKSITCIFCSKSHKAIDCRIITDVERRRNIVREKRLCFICLRSGHIAKNCSSKIKCYKCEKRHHTAICKPKEKTDKEETHNGTVQACSGILLQTAQARVSNSSNHNVSNEARILFDSGSQLSYISPQLRDSLKLKSLSKRDIAIHTFGKISSKESLEQVKISIHCASGDIVSINCYVKDICAPLTNQPISNAKETFPHLHSLKLADTNPSNKVLPVDILIGSDFYWDFITNDIVRGNSGPIAINSKLGYILHGSVNRVENNSTSMLSHMLRVQSEFLSPVETIQNDFAKVWPAESEFEKEAGHEFDPQEFNNSIRFHSDLKRYEVNLPFKEDRDIIPDNYSSCINRFNTLKKKFTNNEKLLNDYNKIILEQLEANVVEQVTSPDTNGEIHYLPHRPVIRDDKITTKIRMVFDASNKAHGPSLNECLHPGPSLTEPLLSVLLRFRSHKVAFISDIEKSFLQILLHPDDRDFVRFIWFKDPYNVTTENILTAETCAYRINRVLFGLTCSPFLLTSVLRKLIDSYRSIDPDFVEQFINSLHVDDLNSGANSDTEAYEFYQKCKDRLADASFKLRKFQSNSRNLETMVTDSFSAMHLTDSRTKVLGITWDKHSDNLLFNFDHLLSSAVTHPTKRELLSFIGAVYDPLGLLNPFMLKLKCLFQSVCVSSVAWDDKLNIEHLDEWKTVLTDMKSCDEIFVPRCYGDFSNAMRVELQGFSDASLKGYGCCVYVRFIFADGSVKVSLVTSQSRVAPISKPTVPRLELQAAVLLSKCVANVNNVLSSVISIDKVYLWSDSTITLSWIKHGKTLPSFVQRRVDQILVHSERSQWFHIESAQNPADVLSRGCHLSFLRDCSSWFDGPLFLFDSSIDFDKVGRNAIFDSIGGCSVVFGEEGLGDEVLQKVCLTSQSKNLLNLDFMQIEKYSNYEKLIRVTAYVFRFIDNLKKKILKKDIVKDNYVTLEEFKYAENKWILFTQIKLQSSANYKKLFNDLNIFDDNGILKAKGRIKNAQIDNDAKFPIVIPRDDKFSELLVKYYHQKVLHNGMRETLNALRSRFWIPQARNYIKRIIHRCILCKRFEGKPFSYPQPPDLPAPRVSIDHPFTYTGVDYAGPIYVKNIYQPSSTFKAWIFLYTCASSRAIYLDLVPDCFANTCIRSLRRFISDRGAPKLIISDNGTQFTACETQTFATNRGICWKFNLPAAPWWGGIFERLVRSTKRCLKKILFRSYCTYEEILTVLTEIQCVINNRPLTHLYDEPSGEALTPHHLLFGRH